MHRSLSVLVVILVVVLCGENVGAQSTTIYVAVNGGSDAANCGGITSPCQTIGYAVANAIGGENILLQGGNYNEAVITVNKILTITGSADVSQPVLWYASGGRHLILNSYDLQSGVTITFVTFQGGVAATGEGGGSILVQSGLFTCNTCGFVDNRADYGGAVAALPSSSLAFTNVNFITNLAQNGAGGGLYAYGVPVSFNSVRFSGNIATNSGGGAYIEYTDADSTWLDVAMMLYFVSFLNNTAIVPASSRATSQMGYNDLGGGGGLAVVRAGNYTNSINFQMVSCTFESNQVLVPDYAPGIAPWAAGGGAAFFTPSPLINPIGLLVTLRNVDFFTNQIGVDFSRFVGTGGGLFFGPCVSATASNGLFQGNSASTGGGAMVVENALGAVTFLNTLFTENQARSSSFVVHTPYQEGGGGGLACYRVVGPVSSTSVYVQQCTFYLNSASVFAGAISAANSAARVDGPNCVILENFGEQLDPVFAAVSETAIWPGSVGSQLSYATSDQRKYDTLEAGLIIIDPDCNITISCGLLYSCFFCAQNNSCGWNLLESVCRTAEEAAAAKETTDWKPGFLYCCTAECQNQGQCDKTNQCACRWAWAGTLCTEVATRLKVVGGCIAVSLGFLLVMALVWWIFDICIGTQSAAGIRAAISDAAGGMAFAHLQDEISAAPPMAMAADDGAGASGFSVDPPQLEDPGSAIYEKPSDVPVIPRAGVSLMEHRPFTDKMFFFAFNLAWMALLACTIAFAEGQPTCLLQRDPVTLAIAPRMRRSVRTMYENADILMVVATACIFLGGTWIAALGMSPLLAIVWPLAVLTFSSIAAGVVLAVAVGSPAGAAFIVLMAVGPAVAFITYRIRTRFQDALLRPVGVYKDVARGIDPNLTIFIVLVVVIILSTLAITTWIVGLLYMDCAAVSGISFLSFLALYWTLAYLRGLLRFCIGGSLANWYFSSAPTKIKTRPLIMLMWGLAHCMGSIALGSLLLEVLRIPMALRYVFDKESTWVWFHASDQAFVHVAMFKESFFSAARSSHNVSKNARGAAPLNPRMGNILIGFKIGSAFTALAVAAGLIDEVDTNSSVLFGISIIIGYEIGSIFHSFVSGALDAMYLCYCHDIQRAETYGTGWINPRVTKVMARAHTSVAVYGEAEGVELQPRQVEAANREILDQAMTVTVKRPENSSFGITLSTWTVDQAFAAGAPMRLKHYRSILRSFEGIGGIPIFAVKPNSPAASAGIKVFHIVLEVNDTNVCHMAADVIHQMIVESGTEVTLHVCPLPAMKSVLRETSAFVRD